jgi:putative flippase GtrA
MVGGVATAFHYCVAALLATTGLVPVVAASTIGFMLSALLNYQLNANFTFNTAAADLGQAARFAFTVISGCLINAVVLQSGIKLGLHPVAAQVLATLVVLAWNFSMSCIWIFRRKV